MSLTATYQQHQNNLKSELQNEPDAAKFENLSAALLGRLLEVPVLVAKSGFQHGGDAGSVGRQGRRFRLECKKYSDTTRLSDRELLGEIDHALSRDEALEAWFLIATRNVSEQLAHDLMQKGERLGVPVVILDWKNNELAPLAALCAFAPDIVEAEFSNIASAHSLALQPIADNAIEMLRREMQAWCLGFGSLRTKSHEKLSRIWNSPRSSNADLGQDAAGGAHTKKIRRTVVHQALNNWWTQQAKTDAPAAVIGLEGVGKTWATLDWLVDNISALPIVLVVPSSAAATLSSISETKIKQFLAEQLYEVSRVRNSEHWLRRLDYLLKRPADEGPVLTIFFDGLNQEPSVQWSQLFKVLQGESFSGKVRLIISTRPHHFEDKLSRLRGLIAPVTQVDVGGYDTTPGGEFDQMLAFEGLTQAGLHSDLIELARTPRLFRLVIRFRDRLVEAGQVTVHRLLWEYGRDTLGVRVGKSFSESEWQAWLKEIAQKYRDGIRGFSVKSLGETVSRHDLSETEIYARLSDIIDGRFAESDLSGELKPTPTVIAHALGAALLAHLSTVTAPHFTSLNTELTRWLDPISGLDQRAEILRAAVSILVEQNSRIPFIADVLVTAWLQTQNVTDSHRQELAVLASNLIDALLAAIEQSDEHTHTSARLWAVNALRAIPRDDVAACTKILARIERWFSIVSRDVAPHTEANSDFEKKRSEEFKRRIGTDTSGLITVAGIQLELVDHDNHNLTVTAPSLMEGFPLVQALPILKRAAITLAIRRKCESWDRLKWLCLFNEVDPDETTAALRALSKIICQGRPEPGIHSDIPARIAALLLWMTGHESDDAAATAINPQIDQWYNYEQDYLQNPGHSFFTLERRHAEIVLNDTDIPIISRIERTKEVWLDPSFQPPTSFIEEVRDLATRFEVDKLNRQCSYTIEDHHFDDIECALAKCAPDLLADMMRRKIQCFTSSHAESRYWRSVHAPEHWLLAGANEASAAKSLRLSSTEPDKQREDIAANQLLMLELRHQDVLTQFDTLINANLDFIMSDLIETVRQPSSDDIDAMIFKYADALPKQKDDLLLLLSLHSNEFSDSAWAWITDFAKQPYQKHAHVAFRMLARSNPLRFGQMLDVENWHWSADKHDWINHYGTSALIQSTQTLPFDEVAPRLAPWRLLEAARLRGNIPDEIRLATTLVGHIIFAQMVEKPDLGVDLLIEKNSANFHPFTFSAKPRQNQEDSKNHFGTFMDADAQIKAHNQAVKAVVSRIREFKLSGANLCFVNFDTEDFIPVLQYAPDLIEPWLDGAQELIASFRQRVHRAEGAFLALCEALLSCDPMRGVNLWRALRSTVLTNYIGEAGIEDLLHMIFRVQDSPEVIALREELFELKHSNTDRALLDLAIAASINGKSDWLNAMIESDQKSDLIWKRKRGVVLSGFSANNTLPVANAWPDGQIQTTHALLEVRSARFRWIEACAHHWWKIYLQANEPDNAYAAWRLFLNAADHRAWIWMHQETLLANDSSSFFKFKLSHAQINQSELKRAMKKRTEKLDEKLFDQDVYLGIGPWGKDTGS